MKNTKIKLYIIQEILSQFRIPVFNRLSNEFDLKILFSYPTKKKKRKIPSLNDNINFRYNIFKGINIFNGAISFHQDMIKSVLKEKPDVLIMENRLGFLTTVFLRFIKPKNTKIIWWLSGYESSKSKIIINIKRSINRYILYKGNGYICYSDFGRQYLNKLGIKKNIFMAYNSIDTTKIFGLREKYSTGLKKKRPDAKIEKPFILLSTGRLEEHKNNEIILDAIYKLKEEIKNIKYYCIGDGTYLQYLKELVLKFKITKNVIFTGEITDETILINYFEESDVYILPGLGGLGVNHALAYGKPILISEGDGTEREFVKDNYNGLYFKKNDSNALSEKILYLYHNPLIMKEMGRNSYKMCKQFFNIEIMINEFKKAVFNVHIN